MNGEFRWGIIGTGYVARKFVLGLRYSQSGVAKFVFSRTPENATNFAADFGIAASTSDFSQALRNTDIDAYYIATPPDVHHSQTIACLKSGRAALVEKPFANSVEEAKDMVDAAASLGVFCMEGMWTRHLPAVHELRKIIASGVIGEIRSFTGSFGASTLPDYKQTLFNASTGGGALAHRGIYPLAMALDCLGPAELESNVATLKNGIDEDCVIVLRHANGALSTIRASLRAPLENDFRIEGTHGVIHVAAPIYRPFKFTVTKTKPSRPHAGGGRFEKLLEGGLAQYTQQRLHGLSRQLRSSGTASFMRPYHGNGYQYQADETMRCVRAGLRESPIMPWSDSIRIAELIADARANWTVRDTMRGNRI